MYNSFISSIRRFKFGANSQLLAGFIVMILLLLVMAGIALVTFDTYQKDLQTTRKLDTFAENAQNLQTSLRAEALDFATLLIRQEANLDKNFLDRNTYIGQSLIPSLTQTQLTPSQRNELDIIINQHRKLDDYYKQALDQAHGNDYVAATITWANQIQPIMEDANNRASRLFQQLIDQANRNVVQATDQGDQRRIWFIIALTVALVLSLLVARTTTRAIVLRNRQVQLTLHDLQNAHNEIESKQRSGESVSQEVLGLAAELKGTATQQVSGSQTQVATVSEVNQAMRELSEAAQNIAGMASQVSSAIGGVVASSLRIEETTDRSVEQSREGRAVVLVTINVSQQVAELYQQLLGMMKELSSRHVKMLRILDLLNSIAAETHLLSLNAAIEAVGAGEHGERFSVVAQEVKNLANRSSAASREVLAIVQEIEQVTTEVVEVAESGYTKAQEMAQEAEQTGVVIDGMRQISEEAQQQATTIHRAAQEVKSLAEVIKTATSEQLRASEKVLISLTDLSGVAQQNASSSNIVWSTATNLEEVSRKLNRTLVTT